MDDYLSTAEAADRLGVSYNTLISWVYRGKMSVVRRGRFYFVHVSEVQRHLEMRTERYAS